MEINDIDLRNMEWDIRRKITKLEVATKNKGTLKKQK